MWDWYKQAMVAAVPIYFLLNITLFKEKMKGSLKNTKRSLKLETFWEMTACGFVLTDVYHHLKEEEATTSSELLKTF
jgi:hypothetical protein